MVFFFFLSEMVRLEMAFQKTKKKQSTCNLWNEKKTQSTFMGGKKDNTDRYNIFTHFLIVFTLLYSFIFFFVHYTFYTDYIDSNEIEC